MCYKCRKCLKLDTKTKSANLIDGDNKGIKRVCEVSTKTTEQGIHTQA